MNHHCRHIPVWGLCLELDGFRNKVQSVENDGKQRRSESHRSSTSQQEEQSWERETLRE